MEVLSERLYRVGLENGHRLLGFVPARTQSGGKRFATGDKVMVELSPLDLSKGRIRIN